MGIVKHENLCYCEYQNKFKLNVWCLLNRHAWSNAFYILDKLDHFNSLNATDFQITELLCTLDFGYKKLKAYDIRDQHFIENLKITWPSWPSC